MIQLYNGLIQFNCSVSIKFTCSVYLLVMLIKYKCIIHND